jgi:hypothetical protein
VERKQTAIDLITGTARWAAFLLIVLSVLSTQQSWAAIACNCESHDTPAANASHCRLHNDDPAKPHPLPGQQLTDSKQRVETNHSAHHHAASDGSPALAETHPVGNPDREEGSLISHSAIHHDAPFDRSGVTASAVPATDSAHQAGQSSGRVSCCCIAYSSPVQTAVTFATQQTVPVEDAPAVAGSAAYAKTAPPNSHSPPGLATSRPLYIVQSSLLI